VFASRFVPSPIRGTLVSPSWNVGASIEPSWLINAVADS
jgi:hypothetical protein